MTQVRRWGGSFAVLLALAALALVAAAPALGATHTWSGPAGGAWSNAANWNGGVPTSGELGGTIVQFGANTKSTMNIVGLAVDQIHFTGANNTIEGSTTLTINGSTLAENVVSEAGGNTLGATLPIALSGAALEAASSAGTLTIAGTISGALGVVFVSTGGDSALTASNTYTGPTFISSGALHIATSVGDVIVGSSITIGSGAGPGAELVLDQSSDISPETPVTVNSDGVFNFQAHIDTAKSLTVNGGRALVGTLSMKGPLVVKEGTVTIEDLLMAGSLNMTGGTIDASAQELGVLALSGDIQATSSPAGPATVASGVRLSASPTVTVTPGSAPELRVTGAISETGAPRGITKAGAGTMLTSANNTYTGTTTVSEGTLLADGSQAGPFSVDQNGTLGGSGKVGATTVAGVLAPTAPGLHTGALSFEPTGNLDVTLTSVEPAAVPTVDVAGAVTINPSAALNFLVASGTVVPRGSTVSLIDNDASDAIVGQFANAPMNSVLSTVEGIPLVVNYAGGDGNDLVLTAPNAPPQSSPTPVTTTPTTGGTKQPASNPPPAESTTATANSPAYGADFSLTSPSVCLRKGAKFSVTLSVKKLTKAKGGRLLKVTKVVFALAGKSISTDRSAPFRVRLTLPRTAKSRAVIELRAKAYLEIRGGKRRVKSIAMAVKVC